MSPRAQVLFKTGGYGSTVKVIRREHGALALLFRKRGEKNHTTKALNHGDLAHAKRQAKKLSLALANEREVTSGAPGATDALTVAQLLARYQLVVSNRKKGSHPKDDARRRKTWVAFLQGHRRKAHTLTPTDVREFISARRAGKIRVKDVELVNDPKPRTVDADVVYLLAAYNWAYKEARLLREPVLRGAKRPEVSGQMRPMASAERAAKVLKVASQVDPRFPLLMTCVRWLGWRVSAICAIDLGKDIRRTPSELAPYGEIRKNWAHDKEGVAQWVPMPQPIREQLDTLGLIGTGWAFPAKKAKGKHWSRWYARDLLVACETLAKLDAIEGGQFHPYRRLWATERKHFPLGDVGSAGGWKDRRSLEKYTLNDPATTSAVMLYDPASVKTGSTTGSENAPRKRKGGRRAANR